MVFDEAHTLESVASSQLGLRLSQAGLRFDLRAFITQDPKGSLAGLGAGKAMAAVERALAESEEFSTYSVKSTTSATKAEGSNQGGSCQILSQRPYELCSDLGSLADTVDNETAGLKSGGSPTDQRRMPR